MSTYVVVKTINGRQYRYSQETWREGGRMKTRSQYLGPVDGGSRRRSTRGAAIDSEASAPGDELPQGPEIPRRRRPSTVTEFLRDLVRKRDRLDDIGETETEARERVGREDRERARNARVNELLTADTISTEAIGEIADMQSGDNEKGESADSPDGSTE